MSLLQARTIVRLAKRHKMTLARNEVGFGDNICARGVVSYHANGRKFQMYVPNTYNLLGVTEDAMDGLEAGFEGREIRSNRISQDFKVYERYRKVGERVAKLAGLSK